MGLDLRDTGDFSVPLGADDPVRSRWGARLHPVTPPASVQQVTRQLTLTINSTSAKLGSEKRLFATSSLSPNKANELKFPLKKCRSGTFNMSEQTGLHPTSGNGSDCEAEPEEEVETGLGWDENYLNRRQPRRETV